MKGPRKAGTQSTAKGRAHYPASFTFDFSRFTIRQETMLKTLIVILGLLASFSSSAQTQVELRTNMGRITLELYPDKAPQTVGNFLQYVKAGFYNGTIFHRVIPHFMIQGGGFTTAFERKKTRDPVRNEAENGLKNAVGTIAMARTADGGVS